MTIKIRNFRGEIPKIGETYLPDGYATLCQNARIRSGQLEPFHSPKSIATATVGLGNTSFGYFGASGGWRTMGQNGKVIQGPVATSRYYYVDSTNPIRVAAFGGGAYDYPLRLLSPTGAATVAITVGTPDPDTREEVVFSYTHVTSLDEESQPSPLSARVNWSPGVTIRVNAFAAVPAGRGIDRRRIYRSVTDYAGIATLFFLAEITTATTFFDYTGQTLAEPLPSEDWDPPVTDLRGIVQMPNGIVAGFFGKDLYFCEPFILHAWPDKYSLRTDSTILGIAAFGTSLAVMTSGQPYLVQGTHPSNMVMTKIEAYYPCVSTKSIVDMGYFAAYASTEGIVAIDNNGARLLTGHLFTSQQWQDTFSIYDLRAGRYDGRYVFWVPDFGSSTVGDVYMIDTTGETPDLIRTDITGRAYSIGFFYNDPEDTELYFLRGFTGTAIWEFDDRVSAPMTYKWTSKRFMLGQALNYAWGRCDAIVGSGETATVKLYGGMTNDLIHTFTTLNEPVRLPSGRLDDTFKIEVSGTAKVFSVAVGFDPTEVGS